MPGSSPSRRAEMAWRICMQVIPVSRLGGSRSSPSIVGRGGRADAAVPGRPRRRPHGPLPCGAGQPGRRVAAGRPSRGPDDADDVTQDTFVRAWRALPAFRGDSSARTWLLAIARRACADAVRRNVRRRRLHRRVEAARRRRPRRDRRSHRHRTTCTPRRRSTRPAGRVRAHPGGRVLLRGGGLDLRRTGRHHPLARRARARAACSRPARAETG